MNRKFTITLAIIAASVGIAIAARSEGMKSNAAISPSPVLKPAFINSKRNAVKLYPNPTSNGMIKVSALEEEELHFYIFDLEGVLIAQKILNDKKLHTINNLKKGVYLYDVFKKDISIEQGSIVVK